MKSLVKSLAQIGLVAALCTFLAVPVMAQRGGSGGGGGHPSGGGGGGGGHVSSGGGGGGGHVSSGGGGGGRVSAGGSGFSGGGRVGVAPSGGRPGMVRPSGGMRPSMAPRAGFSGQRGAVGYRGGVGYRGNVRAGATGVTGTRPYIRGNNGAGIYGHGGGYGHYGWGNHNGWFFHSGYYGSLYYPWLGFGYWALPYGCYPFYWGSSQYYYGDGFYYQYDGGQYTVVEPPVGAEIKSLPDDAKPIMINGEQYYEEKGVYYQPVKKDDGTMVYQVAGKDGELNTGQTGVASVIPKVGDIVPQLPTDCRKVRLNGATYYISEDGIYYQETVDANGNKAYKIVALDSGDQNNQQ